MRPPIRLCLCICLGMLSTAHSIASETSMARSRYILNCAGCHRTDGSGVPSGGIPTLRGQMGHFLTLPEGRAFLIQVPGTSNSPLSNAEIAVMLTWMAHEFSADTLPENFMPYTETEVAALRKQPLTDVFGTRKTIIEKLIEQGFKVE